jgi:hypothetical protein
MGVGVGVAAGTVLGVGLVLSSVEPGIVQLTTAIKLKQIDINKYKMFFFIINSSKIF